MGKKIMIVDDDPVITKYLKAIFEDNGYETCVAEDGKKAISVFQDQNPDLITLDLEMPEDWGPRFYRKVSKTKGFDTPVIVISGLTNIRHSIPKAAAAFGKPFEPDEILQKVKEVLG